MEPDLGGSRAGDPKRGLPVGVGPDHVRVHRSGHVEGREMTENPSRKCVICGARVTNKYLTTMTCDATCRKAREAGRDRSEQFAAEMAEWDNDPYHKR